MSNKQKKKRQAGRRRFNQEQGAIAINTLLNAGDLDRLDDMEIMKLKLSMYAALDDVTAGYSPVSYNVLTHFYRIARDIAKHMKAVNFAKVCEDAKVAIGAYYDMASGPLPASLKQPIMDMLDALCAFLPEVPRGLYNILDENSREYVQAAIVEKFVALDEWQRRAAFDMLANDTRIDAVALDVGKTTAQVADATLSVGAMLHILAMDSTIPFPGNLQELMATRGQLERPLLLLYSTQAVVDRMEAAGVV